MEFVQHARNLIIMLFIMQYCFVDGQKSLGKVGGLGYKIIFQ